MRGPFLGGSMHRYIYLCGCKRGIKGTVAGTPAVSRTPADLRSFVALRMTNDVAGTPAVSRTPADLRSFVALRMTVAIRMTNGVGGTPGVSRTPPQGTLRRRQRTSDFCTRSVILSARSVILSATKDLNSRTRQKDKHIQHY